MAIKVIKHGQKPVLKKTCPVCGCEFEFELEDLQTDYTICLNSTPNLYKRYVVCPDCGEKIYYDAITIPTYPWTNPSPIPCPPTWPNDPWRPYVTWTTNELDCDKCPNKPDPNKIVVGDTPCTWCRKNQPYCTTTTGKVSFGTATTNIDPTTAYFSKTEK